MKKGLLLMLTPLLLVGCTEKEEEALIKLDGNPTTGYEWNCTGFDSAIISVEKEYEDSNTDEDIVGAGGTYEFEIKGLKEGTTTLKCEYSRSFEENSTESTKEYKITVDKKLNVTYEEVK